MTRSRTESLPREPSLKAVMDRPETYRVQVIRSGAWTLERVDRIAFHWPSRVGFGIACDWTKFETGTLTGKEVTVRLAAAGRGAALPGPRMLRRLQKEAIALVLIQQGPAGHG